MNIPEIKEILRQASVEVDIQGRKHLALFETDFERVAIELVKKLTLTDVSSSGKCSRCEVNDAQSEHTCPYAEEINNDSDSLCDCCSDCEHECCMDI